MKHIPRTLALLLMLFVVSGVQAQEPSEAAGETSAAASTEKAISDQKIQGRWFEIARAHAEKALPLVRPLPAGFQPKPIDLSWAIDIFEAIGNQKLAIILCRDYVKLFKNSPESHTFLLRMADHYATEGKYRKSNKLLKKIAKKMKDHGEQHLSALLKIGQNLKNHKKKKKRKRAKKIFTQILEEYDFMDEPNMVTRAVASEAAFELGLSDHEAFGAIQLDAKNLRKLRSALENKATALQNAEHSYQRVFFYRQPSMTSAAIFQTALLYHEFAEALLSMAPPLALSIEETDMYMATLEEMAWPIQEKAQTLFASVLHDSHAGNSYNQWAFRAVKYIRGNAGLKEHRKAQDAKKEAPAENPDEFKPQHGEGGMGMAGGVVEKPSDASDTDPPQEEPEDEYPPTPQVICPTVDTFCPPTRLAPASTVENIESEEDALAGIEKRLDALEKEIDEKGLESDKLLSDVIAMVQLARSDGVVSNREYIALAKADEILGPPVGDTAGSMGAQALAALYLGLNKPKLARLVSHCGQVRPEHSFAHCLNNEGLVFAALGDWQRASASFKTALEEGGDIAPALNLANIAIQFLNYSVAEDLYRQVLSKEKGNIQACAGLLVALGEKRKDTAAALLADCPQGTPEENTPALDKN